MMHARRVDGAVAPGRLGIGETVEVRTRMGHLVARGDICGQTPFGITLREDGTTHKFYMAEFFLFFPEEPEVPEVAANLIADAHPDARVRARLGQVAEQDIMGATPKAQKVKGKGAATDDAEAEAATDDEEDEETPEEAAAPANDTPNIDVDKLPKDIKQAVMVVQKLDDDQLNYILAQTGQALMSALRRNSVNEADLHGLVQKSQNAIYRILTGKPAREWKKAAGKK
jgi:hypothetical protein